MKHIGKILIGIFLIGLSGCEPVDFSDIAPNVSSDVNYLFSDSISIVVGNDGLATINGKDSCFVELVDGEDVVELNTLYSIGDKYFYGGITSYVKIHPLSEGVAHCRLFNTKFEFDTTIIITVTKNHTPGDTSYTTYTFYPEDRDFPISQERARLEAKGPKVMGTKIMDKFLLSSGANGSNSVNNNCTSWIDIRFNYVGTTYVKFYNEDFDTLIQVNILPTYTTFEEPDLDFDDTWDSVVAKMGTPQSESTDENYLVYNCQGLQYAYTIRVNLLSSGLIKDYEVAFTDEEAKTELRAFVEERYMNRGTWNGYFIYARAFDTTYPSLYDSGTKVVVENFLQGKITYKNPENHTNW